MRKLLSFARRSSVLLAPILRSQNVVRHGAAVDEWGLPPKWSSVLAEELSTERHAALRAFVAKERAAHTVYPPPDRTLRALREVDFDDVRVVIVGQDPYHGPGQADGLAFSVAGECPTPPSLRNILKELRRDLSLPERDDDAGDLSPWASRGVLLLNTLLTVRAGQPTSHKDRGWEEFSDAVVAALVPRGVIFLLWGAHARKKVGGLLDAASTTIALEAPHPSPLSARRGFFGSGHFTKANIELEKRHLEPIDWATGVLRPSPQNATDDDDVAKGGIQVPSGTLVRIDLNCPYSEKEDAKAKGARWDPIVKTWYFLASVEEVPTAQLHFARWLPPTTMPPDLPSSSSSSSRFDEEKWPASPSQPRE
ncbi:hypothetical protein CTAYLR_006687 [Chrysophaeum taylorii]|uniref:Uracil-DNA glycosylase n=1 Tax=Chrysophaeum taylorii TaxID=2483200 RepID=A0AAD7UFN7_9STRA|nr:hypothetical protein CTAYLR_006687 [Chrysophaeum taylorii]